MSEPILDLLSGPLADEPVDPFEVLVETALAGIPAPFSSQLDSVAVVIHDEPTSAQLREAQAHGLLGLYIGVPRTAYGAQGAAYPAQIIIFRGEHLRTYHTPVALAAGVVATVRHEVAHHLGISDQRLAELQR